MTSCGGGGGKAPISNVTRVVSGLVDRLVWWLLTGVLLVVCVVWLPDGDVQRSQFARLLIPGDVGGVAVVRQQVEGRSGAADVSRGRTGHQNFPGRSKRGRKSSRSQRSHRVSISTFF